MPRPAPLPDSPQLKARSTQPTSSSCVVLAPGPTLRATQRSPAGSAARGRNTTLRLGVRVRSRRPRHRHLLRHRRRRRRRRRGAMATKEGEAAEVAAAAGFAPLRRVHRRADSVPREAQPLVRLVGEPPEQGEGGSNLLPTQATFGRRRRQVLSALVLCPGPRVCR